MISEANLGARKVISSTCIRHYCDRWIRIQKPICHLPYTEKSAWFQRPVGQSMKCTTGGEHPLLLFTYPTYKGCRIPGLDVAGREELPFGRASCRLTDVSLCRLMIFVCMTESLRRAFLPASENVHPQWQKHYRLTASMIHGKFQYDLLDQVFSSPWGDYHGDPGVCKQRKPLESIPTVYSR